MPATPTPLLALQKPAGADAADIAVLNGNMDILDNTVTLAGSQTLTNKTLTAPHMTAAVVDAGGLVVTSGGLTVTAGTVTFPAGQGSALTKIAEVVLSGTAASIDFSSIPATYRHLMLELYARGDTAATTTTVGLRFNADSGANYDWQFAYGNAATAAALESFANTSIQVANMPANSATANVFGMSRIDIGHYANANRNKVLVALYALKVGTSTGQLFAYTQVGWWRNNAAITQITLTPAAGNFAADSVATLYGCS